MILALVGCSSTAPIVCEEEKVECNDSQEVCVALLNKLDNGWDCEQTGTTTFAGQSYTIFTCTKCEDDA